MCPLRRRTPGGGRHGTYKEGRQHAAAAKSRWDSSGASWRAALPAAMLCSRAGWAPRSGVLCPPVPGEAGLVCAATYRTLALGPPRRQTLISAAQHPRRSGTRRPWLSKRSAPKGLAEHGGEDGPGVAGGGRGSPGDEPSGRTTIAPSLAISRNRPGATTSLTGRRRPSSSSSHACCSEHRADRRLIHADVVGRRGRGAAVGHDGSGFVAVAVFDVELAELHRLRAGPPSGRPVPPDRTRPRCQPCPVPGPGRPAVLVHAARTGRNTAAASRRRLLAMPVSR